MIRGCDKQFLKENPVLNILVHELILSQFSIIDYAVKVE